MELNCYLEVLRKTSTNWVLSACNNIVAKGKGKAIFVTVTQWQTTLSLTNTFPTAGSLMVHKRPEDRELEAQRERKLSWRAHLYVEVKYAANTCLFPCKFNR